MSTKRTEELKLGTDLFKGVTAGLGGGIVAAWAMNQLYALRGMSRPSADGWPETEWRGLEPEAVELANAIAGRLRSQRLSQAQTRLAAQAVHYLTGSLMGAVYGGVATIESRITAGAGTGFGFAVWLAANEFALPAAGVSPPPTQMPIARQLFSLASHLIYGVTLEAIRASLAGPSCPCDRD